MKEFLIGFSISSVLCLSLYYGNGFWYNSTHLDGKTLKEWKLESQSYHDIANGWSDKAIDERIKYNFCIKELKAIKK